MLLCVLYVVQLLYIIEMDVAELQTGQAQVKDEVGDRCQKVFQDFLEE